MTCLYLIVTLNNKPKLYSSIDNNYKDEESTTFHLMECEEGCELGSCKKLVGDDFSYCEVSLSYAEGSHWHAYEVTVGAKLFISIF